jgi:hypothetical protein
VHVRSLHHLRDFEITPLLEKTVEKEKDADSGVCENIDY